MKKIILAIIVLGFTLCTQSVSAVTGNEGTSGVTGNTAPVVQTYQKLQNPLNAKSVEGVILLAVDLAVYVGVSFAILAIIFVGFKFVMAQGNSDKIKEAKEWFLYIIIGLAILISARVIVDVVINTLEKSGVVKEGTLRR